MKKQVPLPILTTLGLMGVLLMPVSHALAATASLKPLSYVTVRGGDSGNSVAALHVQDQSGTQNDPEAYVVFTTPDTAYQGTSQFKLPTSVAIDATTYLRVVINYRGPPKSSQIWRWKLFDWNTSNWVTIGDNQAALADRWNLLTFQVDLPRRFVKTDTRAIWLQLVSSNASGDAKVDYEAIQVTHGIVPAPSKGPTLAGCPIFPVNSIWNTPVDNLPVHARSADWINSIGASTGFHMDFGSGTWGGGPIGIPYNIVSDAQTKVVAMAVDGCPQFRGERRHL
jgi:hypothetical protein